VTAQGHARKIFRTAIDRRNFVAAEAATAPRLAIEPQLIKPMGLRFQ
jgi:hypothetical protein